MQYLFGKGMLGEGDHKEKMANTLFKHSYSKC